MFKNFINIVTLGSLLIMVTSAMFALALTSSIFQSSGCDNVATNVHITMICIFCMAFIMSSLLFYQEIKHKYNWMQLNRL
jgi:hypothetical protein